MANPAGFPVGNTADTPIVFPFTAIDLTSAVDVMPNQWGLLGDMGMFAEEGVDTTIVEIDYRDGYVSVMAPAERGTIPQADSGDQEAGLFFKVPHFPGIDMITPKDLENRWAFQRGDSVPRRRRTLEDEVARRLQKIKARHDVTKEYLRVGAIGGNILDRNGNTIFNLFTDFGITQQVFEFVFSNSAFAVREFTYEVARYIELNLHGDVSDGVTALVSPEFFEALTQHPNVKGFFLQNPTAPGFQGDLRKGFMFGAIKFIEYNAQFPTQPLGGILQQQTQGMSGVTRMIPANTGFAFPSGTRESFRAYNAPPFVVSEIYKEGIGLFVSPEIMKHGKGVELFHESNPLPICRRPNVLCQLTMG